MTILLKIDVSGSTGDTLAEKAYAYVRQLTAGDESTDLVTFAKLAAAYAKTNNLAAQTAGTPPLAYSATATADEDGERATATFGEMAVGYYLVLPEGGSTSVVRQTDAMLVNVPSAKSVDLNMKSEYPTVTKEASDTEGGTYGENTTARIGDTVYFQLTSKVPDTSAYTDYTFKFNDTLSAGLTFDASSVVVKVDDAPLDSTDYTVTPTEDTAGTTVTIDLSDSIKEQTAGADIVVTYAATLNENAAIGATANGNSAEVEYSNDPGTEETGTSIPDTTKKRRFCRWGSGICKTPPCRWGANPPMRPFRGTGGCPPAACLRTWTGWRWETHFTLRCWMRPYVIRWIKY